MFRKLAEWLDTLMGKRYIVRLTDPERARAARLADSPAVPGPAKNRAAVLLAAADGQSDLQIATRLGTSVATVQRTRRRFAEDGFAAAVGWAGELPESPPGGGRDGPPAPPAWVAGVIARSGEIEGAVGVALVDYVSGTCLGEHGGGGVDLATAAAGNAEVVRAKLGTIHELRLTDAIEDILVTLSTQYHLIRVLPTGRPLFLYVVLDRANGSLAMARHRLEAIERAVAEDTPGSDRP
jgi:hypothetical protein